MHGQQGAAVTPADDERIAYLAGEDAPSLPAEDVAALEALRAELGTSAIWDEPPRELEDQVVRAVTGAAAHAHPQAEARTESWLTRLRARWRISRPALALSVSVAAAAAVAIVLITNSAESTPALQFAMVVQGTALAPAAHGSATLTKTTSGWRIQLSATGLPRRDGTQFYQAWLKNAAGILVPIGTFNDARKVTLWSGVPVTKFRSLSVTQQVANGNPRSTGRRVLTGTIR
jgi:Anti-sigma-K factor rskA